MQEKEYLRSFGRIKGHKLSDSQEKLIAEILPTIRPTPVALKNTSIWLEIGFGAGEHLIQLMEERKNPETVIIGCEPYINGAVKAVRYIADNKIQNAFIHDGDGRDLLDQMDDGAIERCYILFADPWPKKRHHKRRIINKSMIERLLKKLAIAGKIIIATDHADYAEWIHDELQGFQFSQKILNTAEECAEHGILTRYCIKALDKGWPINFFHLSA